MSQVRLNVFNVTDEFYFQQFISNQSIPGPGRSVSLSLTVGY